MACDGPLNLGLKAQVQACSKRNPQS